MNDDLASIAARAEEDRAQLNGGGWIGDETCVGDREYLLGRCNELALNLKALRADMRDAQAEAWQNGVAEGLACDWDAGAEFLPLNPYRSQP